MAEINVNVEAAQAANDTLKEAQNKMNAVSSTMAGNPFQALCSNPDLASGLVSHIKDSIKALIEFTGTIHQAIDGYLGPLRDDEDIQPPRNNDDGGGGNNPINTPPPVMTPTPPPDEHKKIKDGIATEMSELSLIQLDGVVDSLKDMSKTKGKGIDEILLDEKMAEDLKKLLLASQHIPEDLKTMLTSADTQVVRQAFSDIMNGKYPEVFDLNPLNLGIAYRYLSQVAEANNMTVEQLLADADLLKSTVTGFGDAVDVIKTWADIPAEQCQQQILNIYDGNGIADKKPTAVQVVRTFVDYLSEATEIGTEELLTDTNYAEVLQTASQEFGKTSVLLDATSSYSDKGAIEVVTSLFNGKNPGALGMTNEEVMGLQVEVQNLANQKGVTTDQLLSNEKYADSVKEMLTNSQNAKEVGLIYSKRDSKVHQSVVKNLYETKIEYGHEGVKVEIA